MATPSIRILDPNGSKVQNCHINDPAPSLASGQRLSLQENLEDPRNNMAVLEHSFGTATAELQPNVLRNIHWASSVRSYTLTVSAESWDDMLTVRSLVRRDVYKYKPVIHKPAPTEPPKPTDPSFWGGIKWLMRGIDCDLRRASQAICRGWRFCCFCCSWD